MQHARLTPISSSHIVSRFVPVRILMVLDQLNIGGTETYTLSVTRELMKAGISVIIAGKPGKLLDHFLGLGCPVYDIGFVTDQYLLDTVHQDQHLKQLKSIIRSEHIDLVHSHQVPSGHIAILAAKQMKIPCVFTFHGTYYDQEILEALQSGAAVTCVSPAIRRLMESKGLYPTITFNGVDTLEYHPYNAEYVHQYRTTLGLPEDALIILYAGRLSWEKGEICEHIVHEVAALREQGYTRLHLVIAGKGNKQNGILQLVQDKQQLANEQFIHYVGEIHQMGIYYSMSDIVIGTGRVALEALACEKPVIAIGSKGLLGIIKPEIYNEAWNCWFGDHDSDNGFSNQLLSSHIVELVRMENHQRAQLIHDGKKFVTEQFAVAKAADSLINVYLRTIFADDSALN